MIRIVEGRGGRDLFDDFDESGDPESDAADGLSGDPESDAARDAIAALRTLGFAETEARERTKRAARRLRARGLETHREVDTSRLIIEVLGR